MKRLRLPHCLLGAAMALALALACWLAMSLGWVKPPAFLPKTWLPHWAAPSEITIRFNELAPQRANLVYPIRDLPRAIRSNEPFSAAEVKNPSEAAQQVFDAYLQHFLGSGQDGVMVLDMAVVLQLLPSAANTHAVLRLLTDSHISAEEKRSLMYMAYTFHNQGAASPEREAIRAQVRDLALNGDMALRPAALGTYSQLYEFHGEAKGLLPPADAIDLLLSAADQKIIGQQQLVFELADAVLTAPPQRKAELIAIVRDSGDISAVEKAITPLAYLPEAVRALPPDVRAITLETLDQYRPTKRDADGGPIDGKIEFDYRQWVNTYATYQAQQTGQNRERIVLDQLLNPSSHGLDLLDYLGDPNTFNRLATVARAGELESLVVRSRDFVAAAQTDQENRRHGLTMVENNLQATQQGRKATLIPPQRR